MVYSEVKSTMTMAVTLWEALGEVGTGTKQLLGKLWHRLGRPTTNKNGKKAGGKARILPHVMLAVTLRYFAGGDVPDLKLIYHLRSKRSVYYAHNAPCRWEHSKTIDFCGRLANIVTETVLPLSAAK